VMMWFWVSAYAVLLGAELNAELELQTSEDTTTGPPNRLVSEGPLLPIMCRRINCRRVSPSQNGGSAIFYRSLAGR
jgi:hypothetical protein